MAAVSLLTLACLAGLATGRILDCKVPTTGAVSAGDIDCSGWMNYVNALVITTSVILGIAVLYICSFPVFFIARCCNGCGGKKPTTGLCCPPENPPKVYTKSTVMGLKGSALLCASPMILGPILVGLAILSLQQTRTNFNNEFNKSVNDLFGTMDVALTAMDNITKSAASNLAPGQAPPPTLLPLAGTTSLPAQERMKDIKDYKARVDSKVDYVLKFGFTLLLGCVVGPILVILKALVCGPACNKKGECQWCCPLASIWNIGFIALLMVSVLVSVRKMASDTKDEVDLAVNPQTTTRSLFGFFCGSVNLTADVAGKVEGAIAGAVCDTIMASDVCGDPSAFPSCAVPAGRASPKPAKFPSNPLNQSMGGPALFDCCGVAVACLGTVPKLSIHVANLTQVLLLKNNMPQSQYTALGAQPGISVQSCATNCSSGVLKTFSAGLDASLKLFVQATAALNDNRFTCPSLIGIFLRPVKAIVDGVFTFLSKLVAGLIVLIIGSAINVIIYVLGIKRWLSGAEIEKAAANAKPKEVPEVLPAQVLPATQGVPLIVELSPAEAPVTEYPDEALASADNGEFPDSGVAEEEYSTQVSQSQYSDRISGDLQSEYGNDYTNYEYDSYTNSTRY